MQVSDTSSMSANAAASAAAGSSRTDGPSFQDLLSQLQDFASGNIGDAMFNPILAQLGITKEQLDQMSPADREKIEAKVRELMKKEVAEKVDQNLQAQQQVQAPQAAAASASATGTQSGSSGSQHRPRSIDVMV